MRVFGRLSALINFMALFAIAVALTVVTVIWQFDRPSDVAEEKIVEIPQGAGIVSIASALEDKGLISNALMFRLLAYYEGRQSEIKFGEYEIPKNSSMRQILNILVDGKAIQLSVTFPEGLTSSEMVARLNAVPELDGMITELPAEGSLAPNTYAFLRGTKREDVLEQMKANQTKILDAAWANHDKDLPIKSKEELLILASIIEKETGTPDERPLVASVFVNRLWAGMKLQTDPTVIYGITMGKLPLGRGLRQSELAKETPYNTYVIAGLPPTPICNPGRDSILAAANPAKTDFHYFVAKTTLPSDGHNFAVSLEEHNKNVAIFRKAEDEAAAKN